MTDYRVRLRVEGPCATPFHSGTLFGHLCWARRLRDGEAALEEWLAALPEQPFLISDAFPAGRLPRPLLAPVARRVTGATARERTDRAVQDKALRRIAWIGVEDYLALRSDLGEPELLEGLRAGLPRPAFGAAPAAEAEPGVAESHRIAHNTINRLTGATPEAGGLYFVDEIWRGADHRELDVYLRTGQDAEQLLALFTLVGEQGYGRDASLGRGRFTARIEVADERLFAFQGNRLVSLSHGIITPAMRAPRYQLHTHYGKLGGLYAGGVRSPFKHPLLLTRPGATFAPAGDGPFGALLEGVHPHHPEVLHNAWHLCLPYRETGAAP